MDEEIRIMIAGGGTGGHLYPALAIGEEIMQRTSNVKVHYIGSEFGLEANIFPHKGLSHTLIPISGFQRSLSIKSIFINYLSALIKALALLTVSLYSLIGLLSATIPAPACT